MEKLTREEKAYLLVMAENRREELVLQQVELEKVCPGLDDLNQNYIDILDSIVKKLNNSLK